MKRVFITGSSGLIGRWVTQRFQAEGWEVFGYDLRPSIASLPVAGHTVGDILDAELLAKSVAECQPQVVLHLAARADLNGKTLQDYDANITGVLNVCNAVRATKSVQRAIYTSSQLVCKVGHLPKNDTDYAPTTVYGESKVQTEKIVRKENGGGVSWCITRPTTVWGPYIGEHYQAMLHYIRKGMYFHSGKGALYKSYAYAENIAHQYFKLSTGPDELVDQKVFYLADYTPLSLRDYANRFAEEIGARSIPTVPLPLAHLLGYTGDVLNAVGVGFSYNSFRLRNIRTEYIFDMSQTERVCGPLPTNFEDGVKATADWFMKELCPAPSRPEK